MDLINYFRRLVYVQVLLGIVASCIAERNPGLLLVAGALGTLAWYVVEGPAARPMPRWMTLVGTVAASVYLSYEIYVTAGQNMIVSVAHYTIWLQVMLLYSSKTNREYAQILVLSMFQMISASVISTSMMFGLLLAGYCVVTLFTLLLFQLKTSRDLVHSHNQQAAPPGEPVSMPKPVVGRGHRWQLRLTAVVTGLLCAVIGAGVFVIMPRRTHSALSGTLLPAATQRQPGFSPKITLSGGPLTNRGREAMLNVKVTHSQRDIDYDQESWLLRGAVLDHYNPATRTWSNTLSGNLARETRLDVSSEELTLLELPANLATLQAQITVLQSSHRHLFTLDRPIASIASANIPTMSLATNGWLLKSAGVLTGPAMYRLRSAVWLPLDFELQQAYANGIGSPPAQYVGHHSRHTRRQIPQDYARHWPVEADRVRRLALGILAEAGLDGYPAQFDQAQRVQVARVLTDYLRQVGGYEYSLDNPQASPGRDPVVEFLLTHRRGHCELFASGLAALARSVGLPGRVITGYRSGEYNRIGGYYVTRQNNAHAWTQVQVAPSRWLALDPSPPEQVEAQQAMGRGWLTPLRQLWEHLEFAWARKVVAYNRDTRDQVLGEMNQSLRGATVSSSSWPARTLAMIKTLYQKWRVDGLTQVIAVVILFFILVGMVTLLQILIVRRRRMVALQLTALPSTQRRVLGRQLRFYLSMLDLLEHYGHVRPSWQSPYGFAEQLAQSYPMRFEPVLALTEMFYEVRFGYRQLDASRKKRIQAHLSRLARVLRQKPTEADNAWPRG